MSITLEQEEYDALVALAREGATTPERQRAVADYVKMIDQKNGIIRYVLWVQWQEVDSLLPPGTAFPEVWPPELRLKIERTDRQISRADVNYMLSQRATKPVTVMVSPDIGGILGWTLIDDYFRNP